jgi:hypothetical protein
MHTKAQAATARDACILAALSLALSASLLVVGSTIWYGDAEAYVNYAAYMAQGRFDPGLYWRTPGYPLFLIMTGMIATGSVWGTLIAQCLAGASVPVLTYLILVPINRVVALITAGVSAASLIPYQFVMTIYPDEFYMAALVLLVFLLSRWLARKDGAAYLYAITAACLFLAWLRPVGLVLAVICLAIALWRRRALFHVAICVVLFLGANVAMYAWQRQSGPVRSMTGRQVFINIYMNSRGMELSGPHGRELRRVLVDFFRSTQGFDLRNFGGPPVSEEDYQLLYRRYAGDPERLADVIFKNPTMQYFWTLFSVADNVPGEHPDRLFLWAAIEHAWAHPLQAATFVLDNYRSLVVGQSWSYYRDQRMHQGRLFEPTSRLDQLREDLLVVPISKAPLPKQAWRTIGQRINDAFVAGYGIIMPVAYVLMLVGVIGVAFTSGAARDVALVNFLVHLCNVGSLAVLADPQFRYQQQSVPLAIVGGGIGIYWLASCAWILSRRLAVANWPVK